MQRNRVKHLGDGSTTKTLASGAAPLTNYSGTKTKELAEVTAYSASQNSYNVLTRGSPGNPKQAGGRTLRGIPAKTATAGVASPFSVGTIVIVDWELGFPYIDGSLPITASSAAAETPLGPSPNIGGSDNSVVTPPDQTTQRHGSFYRQQGQPKDILPGDQLLTTPDGNKVGALRGNYNVMDAGPDTKAKVETFGDRDLVRVTTEDYEVYSGFGTMSVYNTEGRCGVIVRGGTDQLTQTGGSDEQWTFKLDIGDTGDYFTMEVCTPDGATQAKVNMTANGRVTILATDGLDIVDGGDGASHNEYASDVITKILGSVKELVEGAVTETYSSTRTTSVSETDQKTVGHNESTSVNNHQVLSVGGNQQIKVNGGSALEAKPSNIAIETQVLNGSYFMELGNTLSGGSPLAKAGFTVAVNNGDITLGQNPDLLAMPAMNATVSLNTNKPNSVALGGTTSILSKNPAFMHAVKAEPLMTLLTAMMAIFDSHIHNPPVVGPPAAPMSAAVSPMLMQILSKRVLIGG
jgi:hypothetical protein